MDLSTVRDVHMTINLVHRLVYFVPEGPEEYAELGVKGRTGYFATRAAPMGAVPDDVIIATFYNFSPRAVTSVMSGVWGMAPPESLQAARFRVVHRALERVGVDVPAAQIAEARSLVDPVVAGMAAAGKPLGAANAAVPLPDDPLVALWQQVTVLRECRGDVHIAVLVTHEVGPCECMVLQVGTGRFPLAVAKASRQWDDDEWAAAIGRLAERGWVDTAGVMTEAGLTERERIEADTDRLCAPWWQPVGDAGAARLAELITPIHTAMDAAGTYAALS